MIINIAEELLDHIKEVGKKVKYISLSFDNSPFGWEHFRGSLSRVLVEMNKTYDDGFGRQYLHGCIWFDDFSWSERQEYDGSEWWVHKSIPPLEKAKSQNWVKEDEI